MPVRGPLSHADLSIRDPERSIPFYAVFFEGLGFQRKKFDHPDFSGPSPQRAAWYLTYDSGASFEVEVRPASVESRDKKIDRYAPGLHHMAFHAESRAQVDTLHRALRAAGASILDAPQDYDGAAYSKGYYALFVADPDGLKLEVVHEPRTNP